MPDPEFSQLPTSVQEYRPQCPGCSPEAVTAEDARPCSHYDCPGLPAELEVTCNSCMYDFAAGDGQANCDHQVCETAKRLQGNVGNYRSWLKHLEAERDS